MVSSLLLLWIRFEDSKAGERLVYYLQPDTRPDFPEEVPADEASWVEAFEFLPIPDSIERVDDTTLMVFFDDEEDADPQAICAAINLLKPALLLSWENIEEEIFYQQWINGRNTLLYAPEGLEGQEDELNYDPRLDEATRERLNKLSEKPEEALSYLAKVLH